MKLSTAYWIGFATASALWALTVQAQPRYPEAPASYPRHIEPVDTRCKPKEMGGAGGPLLVAQDDTGNVGVFVSKCADGGVWWAQVRRREDFKLPRDPKALRDHITRLDTQHAHAAMFSDLWPLVRFAK